MKAMFDRTVKILKTPEAQRDPVDQDRLVNYFVLQSGASIGLDKEKMTKLREARKPLTELEQSLPPFSRAQSMILEPSAPPTRLRVGGAWNSLGIEVQPGTPEFLPSQVLSPKANRLDLARWLVSRVNPLTARVWVMRAWQEFFGRGLAKTSEDFGIKGEKPTHPELLDWLAATFQDTGWGMKRMHKLIVMSASYRQQSRSRTELDSRDPENTLLARQARLRLPAESIRDSALAVSGLLNNEIGGRSVRPPQPAGVAELGYGNSVKWSPSTGKERYRRGLYIHFQRTTPYPMLMNFDAPDMSVVCSRRGRSNTALQALNLLNDEVFFEAARALAWRIEREAPESLAAKIEYGFRLCLSRAPTDIERTRLAAYHDRQAQLYAQESAGKDRLDPWVGLSRVLLNLDEFVTRE